MRVWAALWPIALIGWHQQEKHVDSKFWSNDPEDNRRIFRDSKGRMVVKVVTPGGVVGLIGADIPMTAIAELKRRIHCRILLRKQCNIPSGSVDDHGHDQSAGEDVGDDIHPPP